MRHIPQRELRNEIGRVLREVAAGASVRVTVRGRPVADLVPIDDHPAPQRFVAREDLLEAFREVEVPDAVAAEFLRDIAEAADQEPEDPWR